MLVISRLYFEALFLPVTAKISTWFFWDVEFLCVPVVLAGVRIRITEDSIGWPHWISPSKMGRSFEILAGEQISYIIAAGCNVLENDLDIFDTSLEGFAATNRNRDLGTLLSHFWDGGI